MWKDSYKIGIAIIDEQHEELFNRIEKLLSVIAKENNYDQRAEYESTINFMKEYVVKHFRDEEEYQAQIGYPNMVEHVLKHRAFTNVMADYEMKLSESNYDIKYVKELSGSLVAWLIYHVVKEDLSMAKIADTTKNAASQNTEAGFSGFFSQGVSNVFEKIAKVSTVDDTQHQKISAEQLEGDIFVEVPMTGDVSGTAVFGFSKELAFQLIKIMTMLDVDNVDELVCSAMGEIANIISGNAMTMMMENGMQCNIDTPVVKLSNEYNATTTDGLSIQTKLGNLQMAVIQNNLQNI